MKRLEKQLKQVNDMAIKGIEAKQKQNLFHWEVLIQGPSDSPFEKSTLVLNIDFPQNFPFTFPHFKFVTPIYHPNIKDGELCKQMIGQKQWMPNKKISDVLIKILSMISSPQIGSAINLQAAEDFKNGNYEEKVKQMVQKQLQEKKTV